LQWYHTAFVLLSSALLAESLLPRIEPLLFCSATQTPT
jgi:hypothetical protein